MDQATRLHAFDNLRAVMMWLGILLHVAVNHTIGVLLSGKRQATSGRAAAPVAVGGF